MSSVAFEGIAADALGIQQAFFNTLWCSRKFGRLSLWEFLATGRMHLVYNACYGGLVIDWGARQPALTKGGSPYEAPSCVVDGCGPDDGDAGDECRSSVRCGARY